MAVAQQLLVKAERSEAHIRRGVGGSLELRGRRSETGSCSAVIEGEEGVCTVGVLLRFLTARH